MLGVLQDEAGYLGGDERSRKARMKSLKRQKTHSELLDEKAHQPYTLASCSIIVTCHELNLTTLGVEQPEHPSIPSAHHVLGYDGLAEE